MTWSNILMQKYFAAAENDKKRYIEELKAYQQTETYQALIKRQLAKKLKNIVGRYTSLKGVRGEEKIVPSQDALQQIMELRTH